MYFTLVISASKFTSVFVAAIWFHIWKNLSSTQFATSELIFLLRPATPVLFPASLVIGRVTDSRTRMKELFWNGILRKFTRPLRHLQSLQKSKNTNVVWSLVRRIVKLNCIMYDPDLNFSLSQVADPSALSWGICAAFRQTPLIAWSVRRPVRRRRKSGSLRSWSLGLQ